jgi:hypothetical protein
MMEVSDEVQRTVQRIYAHLGRAFSFEALILLTESCRVKRLRFEQERTPLAITGCCVALQDVDLIITRMGMDEILTLTAKLHEIAHLLLGHILRFSAGPLTPTYEEFQHRRETKLGVYRTHGTIYDDSREQDAETLATLLLNCISQEETSPPEFAKDVYGWKRDH